MTPKINSIFIVAGEPSGDIHAAKLVSAIKIISPKTKFFGNGGDKMEEEGVEIIHHIDDLSVMGFIEVVKHLPQLLQIMAKTLSVIKNIKPDKIILVDYPGFNLRLAKKIKKLNLNIPITYFILPQLWAWKEKRMEIMKRTVDQAISIFPFESEWFNSKGLKTTFVGHPLIDNKIKPKNQNVFYKKHNLDKNKPILILLPGSRQQEIKYHWPIFLDTSKKLLNKNPDLQIVLAQSPNVVLNTLPEYIKIEFNSNLAIKHGTAALCSSGTATLECALKNLPMVVCYKMSIINWAIFNLFGKVKFISIVNLIRKKLIVPEIIQNNLKSENIIKKIIPLLNYQSDERKKMVNEYKELTIALGNPGVMKRIASLIVKGVS